MDSQDKKPQQAKSQRRREKVKVTDTKGVVNPFMKNENGHIAVAQKELDKLNVPEPQVAVNIPDNDTRATAQAGTIELATDPDEEEVREAATRRKQEADDLVNTPAVSSEDVSLVAQADQEMAKQGQDADAIDQYRDEVYEGWAKTSPEPMSQTNEEEKAVPGTAVAAFEMNDGKREPITLEGEFQRVPEAEPTIEERIAKLRGEVEAMRAEYVREDYDNTNAWARMKGFFGKYLEKDPQSDEEKEGRRIRQSETVFYQAQYQNKLIDLQNLELERLKQSDVSGKELKENMGNLLKKIKFGEVTELVDARTTYRAENRNWPTKVFDMFGAFGRSYNQLSFKEKMLVVGLFTGGAIGATLSGGAAGAVTAMFLMGGRKFMSGAATFAGSEAALESVGEGRRAKKADQAVAKEMEGLTTEERLEPSLETDKGAIEARNGQIIDFDKASAGLKEDIFALDDRLQNEKWKKVLRKSTAVGLGVAVGSGWLSQVVMEKMGGRELAQSVMTHLGIGGQAAEAVASKGIGEPLGKVVEGAVEQKGSAFSLEDYHLTSADGKRGLWGIIDTKLPEDLHGADRVKAIQALENAIQDKLHGMSPEQLKDLGFPKGDIERIYAGDTIKFGQILSQDDVNRVLSGEHISGNGIARATAEQAASVTPEAAAPTPDPIEQMYQKDQQLELQQQAEAEAARTAELAKDMDLINSDARTYLAEHPEMIGKFNSQLGNIRMGIFQTGEIEGMTGIEYQYTLNGKALGGAEVGQVLRDYGKLNGNPFSSYDRSLNPLHYSQMKALEAFTKAAEKVLGPLSYVKVGESVDEYTRRMMTIALRTGKDIRF